MSGNVAGLVAQTLVEGGVVAWAAWELWSLRRRKPDPRPSDVQAPDPRADVEKGPGAPPGG